MLINEVSKLTGLTKKAIDYYTLKGLVNPVILENGYRDYSDSEVETLKKICVLRKLSLGIDDIANVLDSDNSELLSEIALNKEMEIKQETIKKKLLEELSTGTSYDEIGEKLEGIERGYSISKRIHNAFPGYFGRLINLNFAKYLDTVITTSKQEEAYNKIINFLDNSPILDLPSDLSEYLETITSDITEDVITESIDRKEEAIQNPEAFLKENKDDIARWMDYKNSEEYINSPVFRITQIVNEFYKSSGFVDVFIPALKELSPKYAEYYVALESANEVLLNEYYIKD